MNTRNRFNPENRFIGDIEDGKRYPFGVYKKEECDEKFAVKQTEADLAALTARVEALEYIPIAINSFTASPTVSEIGSSQSIALSWNLNKVATTQNINGIPVTGNSTTMIGVSSNTTYTLAVSDGKTDANRSVSVKFVNRIYYGADVDLSNVTSLIGVLSNDPEMTFTANAGAGEYIIYAIPARLGSVVFYVGGFECGFEDPVEQTLTNRSGYAETYKIYRSTNANLGETTVEIKEA
jgi:hypothetical protein